MFILLPLLLSVVVFQEPALDQASGHGQSSYEYVGCHVVNENPKDGNVAFGPLGVKTPVIFFKQVSEDGTVGLITTAKPC